MKFSPVIFAAFVIFSASPVQADDVITLGQLHEFCISTDTTDRVSCSAFLSGLVQGMNYGVARGRSGERLCLPDNLSMHQVQLILEKVARDAPQFLHLSAAPAIGIAMESAFPCPKNK